MPPLMLSSRKRVRTSQACEFFYIRTSLTVNNVIVADLRASGSVTRSPSIDASVGDSVTDIVIVDEDRVCIAESRHDLEHVTSALQLDSDRLRERFLDADSIREPLLMHARCVDGGARIQIERQHAEDDARHGVDDGASAW